MNKRKEYNWINGATKGSRDGECGRPKKCLLSRKSKKTAWHHELAFGVLIQHRTVGGGVARKSRREQDGEKSALRLNGALQINQHPSTSTFRFPGTPREMVLQRNY